MIRSVAAILFALVIIGAFAVRVQADTITSTGTLTGTSTITATSNPCSCVFDSNFSGSGTDSESGPFTTTNMGTLIFSSSTMFTSSGTFEDVLAGGTFRHLYRERDRERRHHSRYDQHGFDWRNRYIRGRHRRIHHHGHHHDYRADNGSIHWDVHHDTYDRPRTWVPSPTARRNRVPAGDAETLGLGPKTGQLKTSLTVTCRTPLSTHRSQRRMYCPTRRRFPPSEHFAFFPNEFHLDG